jgi:hypothetical protein
LARATGGAGLTGIVLIFVPIIAMTSLGEPAFDATREEAAAFFRNTAESSWADAAGTVALLELVALTWFMVGLCLLLRRAEGEPPWRSTLALVFGALFAAYLFTDASWEAAGNRGADLDPGLAHFAFDMGNLGFAVYLGGLTSSGSRHSIAAPTVMLPAVRMSARRPPR